MRNRFEEILFEEGDFVVMELIFVPLRNELVEKRAFSGFGVECTRQESGVIIGKYRGKKETIDPKVFACGSVLNLGEYSVYKEAAQRSFVFVNKRNVFIGSKRFLKMKYKEGSLNFDEEDILAEFNLIMLLENQKGQIDFIQRNEKKFQDFFKNKEDFENFKFIYFHYPKFVMEVMDIQENENFIDLVAKALEELSVAAGRKIGFINASDFVYAIKTKPIKDFAKMDDLISFYLR